MIYIFLSKIEETKKCNDLAGTVILTTGKRKVHSRNKRPAHSLSKTSTIYGLSYAANPLSALPAHYHVFFFIQCDDDALGKETKMAFVFCLPISFGCAHYSSWLTQRLSPLDLQE